MLPQHDSDEQRFQRSGADPRRRLAELLERKNRAAQQRRFPMDAKRLPGHGHRTPRGGGR
jgi:hypothetical protein